MEESEDRSRQSRLDADIPEFENAGDEHSETDEELDEYALMFEWAELLIAPPLHEPG